MSRPFLTATWEHLLFLNFPCPSSVLEPLVPAGTTLDSWRGETLVSLVGLHFRNTRVSGVGIPFHRTFEEVNLRFYVRREMPGGEVRKGVVFIGELVPRWAVAALARRFYNEPYRSLTMSNANDVEPPGGGMIAYFWFHQGERFSLMATVAGAPEVISPEAEAAFITEHYWGYTRQRDGSTLEYRVEHPRWPVWTPGSWSLEGPLELLFGAEFARVLTAPPVSAYAAPGSRVSVFPGTNLS
jgi:hypothetical protein